VIECHEEIAEPKDDAADGHDPPGSKPFAQARREDT